MLHSKLQEVLFDKSFDFPIDNITQRMNSNNLTYKNNYLSQLDRDQKKEEFCNLNGIHLVEIFSNDPINKTFFKSQGVLL